MVEEDKQKEKTDEVNEKLMKIYGRPESFFAKSTHYCPGCGHGQLHRIIADAMEELQIRKKVVFINSVGCSVFAYWYFNCDHIQVPHGRAPAAATGVKRVNPESIVLTYQGDGDLAAIGTAEIVHAANRGENISVFFVNNAIYGMTGGQMAPTTIEGQKTTTTPYGRDLKLAGYPIKMSELLATLEAPVYIERVALTDYKNLRKVEHAVKKSLKCQIEGKGFSMVEVLSPCPTTWKKSVVDSRKWVEEEMLKAFPLGVYKDKSGIE